MKKELHLKSHMSLRVDIRTAHVQPVSVGIHAGARLSDLILRNVQAACARFFPAAHSPLTFLWAHTMKSQPPAEGTWLIDPVIFDMAGSTVAERRRPNQDLASFAVALRHGLGCTSTDQGTHCQEKRNVLQYELSIADCMFTTLK